MKLLSFNLQFKIEHAGQSLPASFPISNIDIFRSDPALSQRSSHVLQKLNQKVIQDFGFEQRYWAHFPGRDPNTETLETSELLAYKAVDDAFENNFPKNVEAFVLGSTTTCRYTGSQAAGVLGKFNYAAPAYEIKAGCSTSIATLHLAQALMVGGYNNVLVACAETLSKVRHPELHETWLGLADGGAAVWLQQDEKGEFIVEKSVYTTEGIYVDLFTTPASLPPSVEQIKSHGYCLKGDFNLLKDLAMEKYMMMIEILLPAVKERKEITWVIPHQVNRSLILKVIQEMQLTHAEIIWEADKVGNLGGAAVLYALASAVKNKRFNRPGKILLMSVGGGLSYAAQIWQFVPPIKK